VQLDAEVFVRLPDFGSVAEVRFGRSYRSVESSVELAGICRSRKPPTFCAGNSDILKIMYCRDAQTENGMLIIGV
jgi:hypothetical protein